MLKIIWEIMSIVFSHALPDSGQYQEAVCAEISNAFANYVNKSPREDTNAQGIMSRDF
jgi:hypothetical protein